MGGRALRIAAACGAIMALAATAAEARFDPGGRLANGGAEEGMTAWQGVGFGVASYDADAITRFPAPFLPVAIGQEAGERVFFAAGEGAISQTVDLSDVAGVIDGGAQTLSFGALLGGREGQPGAARLEMQPLDAGGAALGQPYAIGSPSDRDRHSKTALLKCDMTSVTAPVGTRAALVRLEAVGQGLADNVYFFTGITPRPDILFPPTRVADGPGCFTGEPVGPWPPLPDPPQLRWLVTMPATNRCGRPGPLRFSVPRGFQWLAATLEIKARGRRIVRAADKTISVAAPRGKLRVAIAVTLRDGRQRTGAQRFSGCR